MYNERKQKYDKSLKSKIDYVKYIIMNDIVHLSVTLFTPFEMIVTILLLVLGTGIYFYTITSNILIMLLFVVISTFYIYTVFILQNRKIHRRQKDLHDLLKYINNVVFMLNSGEVVANAIDSSLDLIDGDVKNDIKRTRDILRKEAVIDTRHFSKYESTNLNQFHKNLEVKYVRGGDTYSLFTTIQKRFANELQKVDELFRKKKRIRTNITVLMAMVYSIVVILAVFTPDLWNIFLSYKLISTISILLYTVAGMVIMYQVQRHTMDISMDIRQNGKNIF